MKITAIADLHGHYPNKLPGGDLLIVAGDLTARDEHWEYIAFRNWCNNQNYSKVIVIAGSHDNYIFHHKLPIDTEIDNIEYLCDSSTEFEGLKIYGMPWTYQFKGINPKCCAFTCAEDDYFFMQDKCEAIPCDTDILITHSPPLNILDETIDGRNVGCQFLREHAISRLNLKYHFFGHIHECGNKILDTTQTKFVNCSYVDENYKPRNKVMEFEI